MRSARLAPPRLGYERALAEARRGRALALGAREPRQRQLCSQVGPENGPHAPGPLQAPVLQRRTRARAGNIGGGDGGEASESRGGQAEQGVGGGRRERGEQGRRRAGVAGRGPLE